MKQLFLFVLGVFLYNLSIAQSWTPSSGNLTFTTGNVGIGTSSPGQKLDVRTPGANGADQYALNIQNPSNTAYSTVNMQFSSGPSSFSSIASQRSNLGSGSTLIFQTTDNTGTIQPRMFVNDAGHVGIGAQNYVTRLTVSVNSTNDGVWVAGPSTNVAFLNNMGAGSWNSITQAGDNMIMWKGSNPDNSDAHGLVLGPWSNNATGIRIGSNGNVGVGISSARSKMDVWGGDLYVTGNDQDGTAFITSHGGVAYYGNNTYSNGLAITSTGQIGIGTYAPGPYKLAVEGTIGARRIKVTLANPWADYVFEKDYKLPSLNEVELFIQKNKHLPGVPSAREVEKNGLDVGDNQTILLKKIEELTLYMIEQNKRINAQQMEIEKLQKEITTLKK